MKKVFLAIAIVAAGITANAQTTFGVKAGLNIANLTGDTEGLGLSSLTSFNAGAFANIPVSTQFSVQPEVLYSGEGAKASGGKLALNYVNIPVLFQYNNSGFYGELGPQLGILTSAKAKPDNGTDTDIKDQLKSTNFSLAFGAGYKLTNGLGFGVRYNLGLSNIADSDEGTLKSNTFAVGAFFAIGKHSSK